jgi:hypothetical protein
VSSPILPSLLRKSLNLRNRIYPGHEHWPQQYLDVTSPDAEDMNPLGDYTVHIYQWYLRPSGRPYREPCYSVNANVPSFVERRRDEPFRYYLQQLQISWRIGVRPDPVGNDRWISIDHVSTLVTASMPSNGMALLDDLVKELTESWTQFYVLVDRYLMQCVSHKFLMLVERDVY